MSNEKSSPSTTILTSLAELQSLRQEWDRLAAPFRTPLLQHDWFLSAAEGFEEENLRIIVLRLQERVVGIAPLVLRNNLGIEHLEILGARELCEPAGFLCSDLHTFKSLMTAALSQEKPLILGKFLAGPEEAQVLNQVCGEQGFFVIDTESACPVLDMTTDWDAFEASMSSSRRSSIRRCRKRLEGAGSLTVECVTGGSNEFRSTLEEAFRIEASGWKGREGCAILSDTRRRAFFTSYALRAAENGIVRLFLMKLNGVGIAMVLAVEYANRLWVLKIGFDEAWSHGSPGIILLHETIRWAFEHRLEGYEFLGSNEPWIEMWTKELHRYTTYRLYPRSLKGIMWLGMEGNRTLLKKAADHKTWTHA